ncbi:MAG: DUF6573 family protein [Desulfosalsimonadaceae bacterium]
MNPDAQKATHEIFGEVIYAYTRKQAIEDGYQVLLTGEYAKLALRAGWKYPVYLTSGIWDLVEKAVASENHCNDLTGVLWDILSMARFGLDIAQDSQIFTVIITGCGRKRQHQFYLQIGPTDMDDPTPAITIMLPEDR